MNFKKGKENFRSKIFVNSQQAHDLSALSAVKEEYCAIFCHPDNNNLNQYQYHHQHKYLQPHQYSNPHQHQTKAKKNQMKKRIEDFDKLFVVPFLLLLNQVSTKSFFLLQQPSNAGKSNNFKCFNLLLFFGGGEED